METDNQQLMWILDEHTPISCSDVLKWGRWYQTADRNVARNRIGIFLVSTVFLATNLRFGSGAPILFETMVFENSSALDEYSRRYSTWGEAVEGHQAVVAQLEALN